MSWDEADEEDQIDGIDDIVGKLYAYLVSFATDASNLIVRNAGEGKGLGSLETTAQRVRLHVVHATRGDLSAGSEPTALSASGGSGICVGGLALKETSIRDVH